MNLTRDLPQVMRLLNQVFSPTLDADGRRALNSMSNQPAALYQWNQLRSRINPGYVWEENGALIGNVSLIPTREVGRVIIANVAVAEAQRRRGIARQLMEAAIAHVAQRNVRSVVLQVDVHNESAARLYRSLGFATIGSTTLWAASAGQWREIATTERHGDVRPLRSAEADRAFQLDLSAYPADLVWPEPTSSGTYRQGWWQWLDNLLNGRASESWTIADERGELLALGTIWSEWGRPYNLTLRILPQWQDQLARPLFAKLLRRLSTMRHRSATVEYQMDDPLIGELLTKANFRPRRHLTTMKLML